MSEELTPAERCAILSKRIENLNKGSGDYELAGRVIAIKVARSALERAQKEMAQDV